MFFIIIAIIYKYHKVFAEQFQFLTYEEALINGINPSEISKLDLSAFDNVNGDSIGFGFWSQCIPLWTGKLQQSIEDPYDLLSQELGQFLLLLKSQSIFSTSSILYFVIFDSTVPSITHNILLDDGNQQTNIQNSFPVFDYEGIWIFTYFTLQPVLQQIIVEMTNQIAQTSGFSIPLENYQLIIGGRGKILSSQSLYNLNFYRGRLSKLIYEESFFYNENHFTETSNKCRVPSKVEGEQTIFLVQGLEIFDGQLMKRFQIDQTGNRYLISGWTKFDASKLMAQMINVLIRITAFQDYSNQINIGDELFTLTYNINEMFTYIQAIVNQYNIPLQNTLPFFETQIGEFNQLIDNQNPTYPLFLAVQEWHYWQYEYGRSSDWRSILKILFVNSEEPVIYYFGNEEYHGSFTNSLFYILLGSDNQFLQSFNGYFPGSMQNLQIKYNYDFDKEFFITCHYSCLKCNGPLSNNCISCLSSSNRVFLKEQGICKCQPDYLDFEESTLCMAFSAAYPYVQEIQDVEQNNVICSFGYFQLPINSTQLLCIKCPQQQSQFVICVDCLFYPQTWYLKPICTQDLVPQIDEQGNAYSLITNDPMDYDLYLIDANNNPQLYPGFADLCDPESSGTNCHLTKLTHIGKVVSIICKANRHFQSDNCILLDQQCLLVDGSGLCAECKENYYIQNNQCLNCPSQCLKCQFNLLTQKVDCLNCDQGQTLVSGQCIQCGKNCKFCKYFYDEILNSNYLKCYRCVDDQQYLLSLDAINCVSNPIQHCLKAFQVLQEDYTINTLEHYFIPQNSGNILTFCGVCDTQFYVYVLETSTCEQGLQNFCFMAVSLIENFSLQDEICISSSPYILYSTLEESFCQTIIKNCDTCISLEENWNYLCRICLAGYYSQRLLGTCEICPVDLHCVKCFQQDKYIQDNWKQDYQAFYRFMINSDLKHPFIQYGQSKNNEDYEIVCYSCQYGYEIYQQHCILSCPRNCLKCLLINGQNICVKCSLDALGRQLSLNNNQCIKCSSNCALCRVRSTDEIHALNPLFQSQDFLYSTYQCLQSYQGSDANLYYDQYFGQYINCENNERSCQKIFVIEINLYCSNVEYQQDLMSLTSDISQTIFKQSNIYINDLFSQLHSNFNQFEQFYFYFNANERQIKTIDIKIVSNKQQTCQITGDQILTQLFSQNIFSAINLKLSFIALKSTIFQFDQTITFSNFSAIKFQGIIFQPIINSKSKYVLFQSTYLQTIEFSDCQYEQINQAFDSSQLIFNDVKSLFFTNFKISKLQQSDIYSFITINGVESLEQLTITNLVLLKNKLINTDILQINRLGTFAVLMTKISIIDCTFINSKFILYNQTSSDIFNSRATIKVEQILITSQVTSTDGFFDLVPFYDTIISEFKILNSEVKSSSILLFGNSINLVEVSAIECQIYQNSTLIINRENYFTSQLNLFFEKVRFQNNLYDETVKFMIINKFTTSEQQINIVEMLLSGNTIVGLSKEKILTQFKFALIYFIVNNVIIDQLIIERGVGLPDLSIANSEYLQITRLSISQSDKYHFRSLHQYLDCVLKDLKQTYFPPSIYIYNSQKTVIINFNIISAFTFNYPLISFHYPDPSSNDQSPIVSIINGYFWSNFILVTQQLVEIALIDIQSQQKISLTFNNITFFGNVLHEYIQSALLSSATLINVNCILCDVQLLRSKIDSNIVINSTDSIIHFKCKSIKINECSFSSNTYFQYDIIKPFLIWGFEAEMKVYLEQIMEIYKILSISGNGVLLSETIVIQNSQVTKSFGSQGGAFQIVPQNEAYFECKNTTFDSVNTFFTKELESGGLLYINAQYSSSSIIKLQNLTVKNVFCRSFGGIVAIINGEGAADIQILNIDAQNTYAKLGSLIFCQFQRTSTAIQKLLINGFSQNNSLSSQAQFLNKYTNLVKQEITQILYQRTLIYVEYGTSLIVQNVHIQQLAHETFLYGLSITTVALSQIQVNDCIFPTIFIDIIPVINFPFSLNINQCYIANVIQKQLPNIFELCNIQQAQVLIPQFQCLDTGLSNQQPPGNIPTLYSNISQTLFTCLTNINYSSSVNDTGLINIANLNLVSSILIQNVVIDNIVCDFCSLGLISILHLSGTIIEKNIKVKQLKIKNSQCGNSSCVTISKGEIQQPTRLLTELESSILDSPKNVYISDYICINNTASSGTCLIIQQFSSILENCIFINNIAKNYGGAIELIEANKDFYLINSILTKNSAQIGGGISSQGQILTDQGKLRTIIQDNVASVYGDNSASNPTFLGLSISQTQAPFYTYTITQSDNLLIQGIINETFYLEFPSGQQISTYYYFDWKSQSYKYPGFQFRISPLDYQNNSQQNLRNHYCSIKSRLVNVTNDNSIFTNNLTNIKQVNFNNITQDFNLDDLILIFDYASPSEIVLQLEFWCSPILVPILNKRIPYNILGQHSNYYLRVNIRTLPCTYGEIKNQFDSTCNMCDSSQDQFSLKINALKCEIKDDISTQSVKSAQLQLKSNYWRPYFDTSLVSYCLNLPQNCLGGWIEGDNSCITGHIGALCEQCDLYNTRGNGEYAFQQKYTCGACSQKFTNLTIMIGTILWTVFSLFLSVRSTLTIVEQHLKQTQSRMLGLTVYYRIAQSGVLIKILTNYLQIIASLTTFQLQLPLEMDNIINVFGNPIQSISYSQDCILQQIQRIQIHYLRMIWQLCMPIFFFSGFLLLYFIGVIIGIAKFNLSIITTSIIYLFLYFQPNLVNGLIQLISFRDISGFRWIQNNVAFRYDTDLHQNWLLKFCLPILIILAVVIPLFILFELFHNRKRLNDKPIKVKWGYLYNEYKITSFFWEIVKILEKDLIIIALVYYEDDVIVKGILTIIIVQIYQELNSYYQPYQLSKFNLLDLYTANISKISFALGIGIYMAYQHQIYQIQTAFFFLIALLNFALFLLFIGKIILAYSTEMEVVLDTIRDLIRKKIQDKYKTYFIMKILENRGERRKKIVEKFQKIKAYLMPIARQIISLNYMVQVRSTIGIQPTYRTFMTNRSEGDGNLLPYGSGIINLRLSNFRFEQQLSQFSPSPKQSQDGVPISYKVEYAKK